MTADVRDVYAYIVATLNADTQLTTTLGVTGVYAFQAPETAQTPYVIINRQSGVHEYSLGEVQVWTRHYIFVKAVTGGTDGGSAARKINKRANDLLSGKHPTIASGYVASMKPKTDIEYIEAEAGGIQFMHVGTVFEIFLGDN